MLWWTRGKKTEYSLSFESEHKWYAFRVDGEIRCWGVCGDYRATGTAVRIIALSNMLQVYRKFVSTDEETRAFRREWLRSWRLAWRNLGYDDDATRWNKNTWDQLDASQDVFKRLW